MSLERAFWKLDDSLQLERVPLLPPNAKASVLEALIDQVLDDASNSWAELLPG